MEAETRSSAPHVLTNYDALLSLTIGKVFAAFKKICSTLDDHKSILKVFPSQNNYTSPLVGSVTILMKVRTCYKERTAQVRRLTLIGRPIPQRNLAQTVHIDCRNIREGFNMLKRAIDSEDSSSQDKASCHLCTNVRLLSGRDKLVHAIELWPFNAQFQRESRKRV